MRPDSGFDVNTQWFWCYMRPDSGFDVNTRTCAQTVVLMLISNTRTCAQTVVLMLIHVHAPRQWF